MAELEAKSNAERREREIMIKDLYDVFKDVLSSGLGTPMKIVFVLLAVAGVVYWAWSRERNKELDRRNALELEKLRAQLEREKEERRQARIDAAWEREWENAQKRNQIK